MELITQILFGILSFLITVIGALIGILYKINNNKISEVRDEAAGVQSDVNQKYKELHDMIHNETEKSRNELTMHRNYVDTSFKDIWEHLSKFTSETKQSMATIVATVQGISQTESKIESRLNITEEKIERKIDTLKREIKEDMVTLEQRLKEDFKSKK